MIRDVVVKVNIGAAITYARNSDSRVDDAFIVYCIALGASIGIARGHVDIAGIAGISSISEGENSNGDDQCVWIGFQ